MAGATVSTPDADDLVSALADSRARAADLSELSLRPMADDDAGYILQTWLRSHYTSSREAQHIGPVYWQRHRAIAVGILSRAACLVASWASDPSVVLGYAITEPGVVHYVYVRRAFRRLGIARRLLAGVREVEKMRYSHRTFMVAGLPLPASWVYDPYEAR